MRIFPPLVALLVALAPVYARAGEDVHVVEKGQTLGRIAKRYHVSVEALREANGLVRGQQIHPGLSLKIPGRDEAASDMRHDGGRAGRAGKAKRGGVEKAVAKPEALARAPKRAGLVRMTRGDETVELQLLTRRGRLVPGSLPGLSKLLRAPTGEKTAIDPRLATMIGLVSDHFGGRPFRVVSGFRPWSPVQYTAHSNHNLGRAMDFAIEGVPNPALRDFCRTFRNAGVGYYPNGTFVHLDARAGKSFWIDYSRSGEAPRYEGGAPASGADETVGEVEPHTGVEGPSAPPESGDGSTKTLTGGVQVPAKKQGNGDTPDSAAGTPPGQGQN